MTLTLPELRATDAKLQSQHNDLLDCKSENVRLRFALSAALIVLQSDPGTYSKADIDNVCAIIKSAASESRPRGVPMLLIDNTRE